MPRTRPGSGKTAKKADFLPINRYVTETIEDMHTVTVEDC